MDVEFLKQILGNDLLNEDTRAELTEAFTTQLNEFKQTVREEVEADVRAELGAQFASDREALMTKLDGFLSEAIGKEVSEFKADIDRFRDHEVEQASKIVEMRQAVAEAAAKQLDTLVDRLDVFLEERLKSEFSELQEDLQLARENDLGRKIFEAFRSDFETNFVDSESVQAKLNAAQGKLAESKAEIKRLKEAQSAALRESKLSQVLQPLTGVAREQMSLILKSVETDKLEESYKRYIGRVLAEGQNPAKKPLTEGAQHTQVKTGDGTTQTEEAPKTGLTESQREELRRAAGIIR